MAVLLTNEVRACLRARYTDYDWLFFEEFTDYWEVGGVRRADAIAINLYKCEIHGFEIKTNRSDWLRELKDLDKAGTIKRRCDRWWLVVGDKDIVRLEELPAGWGLMIPRGRSLVRKVGPEKLNPTLDKGFLFSLLKYAKQYSPSEDVLSRVETMGYEKGKKVAVEDFKHEISRLRRSGEKCGELLNRFRDVAGVELTSWQVEDIGKAVKDALECKHSEFSIRSLEGQLEAGKDYVRSLSAYLGSIKSNERPKGSKEIV